MGETYTTVSTVGASAALGGLVDLDVLDNEVASVKTLGVGVGLSVLQEVDEELGGLLGPASLANTELLACRILLANAVPYVPRQTLWSISQHTPPKSHHNQNPSSFPPHLAQIQTSHKLSRIIIHHM